MTQEASYKTILSLDGGGIRGLMPARILAGAGKPDESAHPRALRPHRRNIDGRHPGGRPRAAAERTGRRPLPRTGAGRDLLGARTRDLPLHQADGIIFGEANPVCVYIRHAPGSTPTEYIANAAAAVGELRKAQSAVGLKPRILIAPGASYETAVLTALKSEAAYLRGIAYVDAGEPYGILGGTRRLGPAQNVFTAGSSSAAVSARDTYAGANAAWLAAYNADENLFVIQSYGSTVEYWHRSGGSWAIVASGPTTRTPGPGTSLQARGLAGALPSDPGESVVVRQCHERPRDAVPPVGVLAAWGIRRFRRLRTSRRCEAVSTRKSAGTARSRTTPSTPGPARRRLWILNSASAVPRRTC